MKISDAFRIDPARRPPVAFLKFSFPVFLLLDETFSALLQVEYAIEAINNAGTCVGILAKDGIVMASERRITSGLLAPAKVGLQKKKKV